jgi:hypothetical protein
MRRAASRCASGRCKPGQHVRYLERHDRNEAFLVDRHAYSRAKTPQEKQRAILYEGPIPSPSASEVSGALHTLQYAGHSPLDKAAMRTEYMRHVIGPLHGRPTPEDLAHYRAVLADPRHYGATAEQLALYRVKLQQAGS